MKAISMWTDYYLKAPSPEAFQAALPLDWVDDSRMPILGGSTYAMDIVGSLTTGGAWDAAGNVLIQPTILEGYHVNLRLREDTNLPDSLEAFLLAPPAFPKRVFA